LNKKELKEIGFKIIQWIISIIQGIYIFIRSLFMRLFNALFKRKTKSEKPSVEKEEEQGKFMPEPEIPVDEKFILNFQKNGGKFLYCLDEEEVRNNFYYILKENNWQGNAFCKNEELKEIFQGFNLNFTSDLASSFGLFSCEFLIANTGSLLFSSNQIGEKKLTQFPENFIVLAKTSQLVETPGDGLRIINFRKEHIPTNITTLKNFNKKDTDKEGHFMNYGSVSKNLYLLLLEDL